MNVKLAIELSNKLDTDIESILRKLDGTPVEINEKEKIDEYILVN